MRAVLDTNVVVSALIWGGPPLELLRLATEGGLALFTSPILLEELREVLHRPHLAARLLQQRQSVDDALTLYAALAESVVPVELPTVASVDPDDDHVIATAVAASADLIVSGDRHLLTLQTYGSIPIVTPRIAIARVAP